MNNNKTILIEGVRYHKDRPASCRQCYFWKNRKVGCGNKKAVQLLSELEDKIGLIEGMIANLVTTYEKVKGADALMSRNKVIGTCPHCGAEVLERQKGWFCSNRECRFVLWKDYASYIKDSFVAELTELSRNMMLSIDILPVPTEEAVREVENRLLGVETKGRLKQTLYTRLPIVYTPGSDNTGPGFVNKHKSKNSPDGIWVENHSVRLSYDIRVNPASFA